MARRAGTFEELLAERRQREEGKILGKVAAFSMLGGLVLVLLAKLDKKINDVRSLA